jgi:hypothetical protein
MWVPAAVAACLAFAFGLRVLVPVAVDTSWMVPTVPAPPPAAAPLPDEPEQARVVKPTNRAKQAPRRRLAKTPPLPPQHDFIRIPYTPSLTPYDGGRVVRVNLPGASVRSAGIPVLSDRVQADLILGDDGVARAIRFVSSSGLNFRR